MMHRPSCVPRLGIPGLAGMCDGWNAWCERHAGEVDGQVRTCGRRSTLADFFLSSQSRLMLAR